MKLQKTIVVGKPLDDVFAYLSDFTTTTEWDPGTETTVLQRGDGGVGTTYLNTSMFLGRKTLRKLMVSTAMTVLFSPRS